MIRYRQALEGIEDAIATQSATWQTRAAERTNLFRTLGSYTEEYEEPDGTKKKLSPFWSEVKPVFMRRQHNKCVYCETKLEGRNFATVQWDLEHFRPKGRIRHWPPASSLLRYDFDTGEASEIGYYLLAYHSSNYAAACKTCNSPFKSDYFPVASSRVFTGNHPNDYQAEEPFLLYPLGTEGEDPEDLILFNGAEAIPKYEKSNDLLKWRKGRILIDFFGLNRDGLVAMRAWWLLNAVWPNVKLEENNDAEAVEQLTVIQSENAPFTNCSRCFIAICKALGRQEIESTYLPILKEIVARDNE